LQPEKLVNPKTPRLSMLNV